MSYYFYELNLYVFTEHKVPYHPLEGLFPDIGREDSLILQTVETLAAEHLFCDRVHLFGYCYDLILINLFCHSHFLLLSNFISLLTKTINYLFTFIYFDLTIIKINLIKNK